VVASSSEIEPAANPMMNAIAKYAKMASYPFLLFVPSLVIFSAAIASLAVEDEEANGRSNSAQLTSGRDRTRVLKLMGMCTCLLFIFLAVLIACADTSRWKMMGVISVTTPVILMLSARLSVIYADTCDVFAYASQGSCAAGLHWCRTVEMLQVAKMLGFVFVFLPFLAGFFYVISPPYLLAVPLSFLTVCTLDGILGAMPSFISIICLIAWWKTAFWMLTHVFCLYSWFVKRTFSVLIFLMCIALVIAVQDLKVPSYL